ncbi:MAG: ABC transporter substrate-binding protein [Planctomycetes bacterium]|nr:ABC transporter substrate-binding protein [Planctomycetota bacterium]
MRTLRSVVGSLPLSLLLSHGLAQAPVTTAAEPLVAASGWQAERIHHSDGGVWYAHIDKVVADFGQNEVIAADDKGRVLLLTVYSGQWTANAVVGDGQWLAPTRSADVDPRWPGREIYAGGRGGSVHRVVLRPQPFARFTLESREIGHAAGEEFHAVVAADLVPGGSAELLAFGITGAVFQLRPEGDGHAFAMRQVGKVPGRVRDVAIVPDAAGGAASMYAVSRSGDLLRLRLQGEALQAESLLREDSGLGRITLAKDRPGVLYVTRDDGVVVRAAIAADGKLQRQAIFAGGQGLRGIAAGRFFADGRESVAAYGYERNVHLIARQGDGPWQSEVVFASAQKGHWLVAGELDGRNGTDELIATGFDGDIVLLARPAGYALPGAAVPVANAGSDNAVVAAEPSGPGPLRLAARLGDTAFTELSPLTYSGGFESKSLVYETLVRLGDDGRLAPGLASSWRVSPDGRTFSFLLREGARWHDDTPVLASQVATHFRRWLGAPQHDWLPGNARITAVTAIGERELRLEVDRPTALLADLCAINPTAITAPAAWSREGEFERALGSGPFTLLAADAERRTLRYRARATHRELELVAVAGDPVDALLAGEVDAVIGSWLVPIEPPRAAALQRDARFEVVVAPGSSVWSLGMRYQRGVLADREHRARVAAAIDRFELVRVAAAGLGTVCTAAVAPAIVDWPAGQPVAASSPSQSLPVPLRFAAEGAPALLVETLLAQLQRAGIAHELAHDRGDADLWLERSHGVPYDPFSVALRHGRQAAALNASTPAEPSVDEELAAAVEGFRAASDPATWPEHFARIQARLDALLPAVPLFAPHRLAIVRRGLGVPKLGLDLYGLDADWLAARR